MYTDWLLIRRLAMELDERLRGARVRDVGRLEDGRIALALWQRGTTSLLCIDVFAPTPAITLEAGELPIAAEPGFVRAAGAALRASTLLAVRSRRGDRLLRLDFGTRSRFGVQDGYSLISELVPRFGNIVLVKGETIVAAVKEFTPSQNAARSIEAGDLYEPPPLRPGPITPLLPDDVAAPLAEHIPMDELFVYRRDGKLLQAHLVPVPKFAEIRPERERWLVDLLQEARATHVHAAQSDRVQKRRRDLTKTLRDRDRKLQAEVAGVDARIREAQNRETLRAEGEALYATLHELAAEDRDQAKERAAKIFATYKKAAAAAEHLARRREELAHAIDDLAQLQWELERANDDELDDVAQAVAALEPRKGASPRVPARRRKPLQYALPSGSRIFVGRTPVENAELTFRTARPDDLWFHVQNQPGAHVILQRDDRARPPESDVLAAAALAALHSKAKTSPKVTVDYTLRKYVRKRPSAAPGLVFYTNPKSVYVSPTEPRELQ